MKKSKLLHEVPSLVKKMNTELQNLQGIVEQMEEKRGGIFVEWMKVQNIYLKREKNFQPSRLRSYKRGEIVFAHFGFNVGSEYGGMHFAIVVRDSSKSNPNLNVVPLTSLEPHEKADSIHRDRVFLDLIEGMNGLRSVALPDQLRPISKLRVYRPKYGHEDVFKLTNEQMNLIDDKIRRLYTKI